MEISIYSTIDFGKARNLLTDRQKNVKAFNPIVPQGGGIALLELNPYQYTSIVWTFINEITGKRTPTTATSSDAMHYVNIVEGLRLGTYRLEIITERVSGAATIENTTLSNPFEHVKASGDIVTIISSNIENDLVGNVPANATIIQPIHVNPLKIVDLADVDDTDIADDKILVVSEISAGVFEHIYEDKPTVDLSGLVPYTGATTDLDMGANNLIAANIGIGKTPTYSLDVHSANYSFMRFLIGSVLESSGYFKISNATSSTSIMAPLFAGKSNNAGYPSLWFLGDIATSTDSGTVPIVRFDARYRNTSVITRPCFQWRNSTIVLATFLPNGNFGIGTATPTALLELKAGTAAAGTAPIKLNGGVLLATPEQGAIEFDGCSFYITNMASQKAIDRTSDVAVATVTVENTTVETTLWTGVQNANSLCAGNLLKFHADGVIENGGPAVTDEITIRIKVGGTTVASLRPNLHSISPGSHWHIDANATQRTIGATGQRAVHIDLEIDGISETITAVSTIDTTANMDVTITAQWASADAANIIKLYQGYMEYKN